MKKNLNFLLFISLVINSFSLFGQETREIFMIDPEIDLKLIGPSQNNLVPGIRVFPDSKSPTGLTLPEYSIVNNRPNFPRVDNGKRNILEIDPRKMPIFFESEILNREIVSKEVIYDVNKPGQFMNLEGDIIFPKDEKNSKRRNSNFRNPIQKVQNKATTDKNTVANSILSDFSRSQPDDITQRISIKNTQFNVIFQVRSFIGNGTEKSLDYVFFLGKIGQFQGALNPNELIINENIFFLFQLQDKLSKPAGRGEAITNAQCIANNLIDLLNQCKGGSKQPFCTLTEQNELDEQLTPKILNGCNLTNPTFTFVGDLLKPGNPVLK